MVFIRRAGSLQNRGFVLRLMEAAAWLDPQRGRLAAPGRGEILSRRAAEMTFGRRFFRVYSTSEGELDITQAEHRELFERYARGNLASPYVCPKDGASISNDDTSFVWTDEGATIVVRTCCAEAARATLLELLAFDPARG
ncbi:MAG TPA: hypothetical protein VG652_10190 [Gaiellaceae bacterium]|nr:hypothetical protein [Gaiellaceae bacterium]